MTDVRRKWVLWMLREKKMNRRHTIIKFSVQKSSSRQMNWIIFDIVMCRCISKYREMQYCQCVTSADLLPPFKYVSNTYSNSYLFSIQQIQYQLHGERLAMWFAKFQIKLEATINSKFILKFQSSYCTG